MGYKTQGSALVISVGSGKGDVRALVLDQYFTSELIEILFVTRD